MFKWAKKKCILIFPKIKKIIIIKKKNTWRYHYFIPVCQQSSWYDLEFFRYRVRQTEIGNYGSFFALSSFHPKNPKNQNFEKMRKIAGDVIILHKFTKNHNHMGYSSWNVEWDRQNFLSFWAIFCHFTPLATKEIKI